MILTSFVDRFLPRKYGHYILITMAYGTLSRGYHIHNATVQREFNTVPMLIRDKVCIMAIGAVTAIELWPMYLYADIGKLELNLRGEYKPPKYDHMIDYIFST